MLSVDNLPPELLVDVVRELRDDEETGSRVPLLRARDLAALAQCCRRLHAFANPALYQLAAQEKSCWHQALGKCVFDGSPGTVHALANAGLDLNQVIDVHTWRRQPVLETRKRLRRFWGRQGWLRELQSDSYERYIFISSGRLLDDDISSGSLLDDDISSGILRDDIDDADGRSYSPIRDASQMLDPLDAPSISPESDPAAIDFHGVWTPARGVWNNRSGGSSPSRTNPHAEFEFESEWGPRFEFYPVPAPVARERQPRDREPAPPHRFRCTALHAAAINGNNAVVVALLDKHAPIDTDNTRMNTCGTCPASLHDVVPHRTALHVAICAGQDATAQLLLSYGASPIFAIPGHPRRVRSGTITALHLASLMGLPGTVRAILAKDQLEPDVKDGFRQTPLAYACSAGHFDVVVPLLLRYGADIDFDLGRGSTSLLEACSQRRFADAARLVKLGADIHRKLSPSGLTPLHLCCEGRVPPRGSRDFGGLDLHGTVQSAERLLAVQELLTAGAHVDARDSSQRTSLHLAVLLGAANIAETLLASGASPSALDANGWTALRSACMMAHNPSMIRVLVQGGADVNQFCTDSDGCGKSALHFAAEELDFPDHIHVVEVLLECGADKTLHDAAGSLPLQLAWDRNVPSEVIDLLLPSAPNSQGGKFDGLCNEDLLDLFSDLIAGKAPTSMTHGELLVELAAARGNFLCNRRETIVEALASGREDLAVVLLDAGALLTFVSDAGWNVLHLACDTTRGSDWGSGFGRKETGSLLAFLRRLIEDHGFDADAPTSNGETPLSIYMARKHKLVGVRDPKMPTPSSHDVEALLLDHGADPHKLIHDLQGRDCDKYWDLSRLDCAWERPMDLALHAKRKNSPTTLAQKMLSCKPLPAGDDRPAGISYLHRACSFHHQPPYLDEVESLLKSGLDANGKSAGGTTPLFEMLRSFRRGSVVPYRTPMLGKYSYLPAYHIRDLVRCWRTLWEFGADLDVANDRPVDGRRTAREELEDLLSYDGGDDRIRRQIERLRYRLGKPYHGALLTSTRPKEEVPGEGKGGTRRVFPLSFHVLHLIRYI